MDVRIVHCTLCWGYRERAVAIAEALREKCSAHVEIIGGSLGQFDVWADGKLIVSRGASIAERIRPPRLPDVTVVLAVVQNPQFAGMVVPNTIKPIQTRREFTSADAKRFYDHFGAKQDAQFYERAALERLIAYGDFEHASAVFELGCGTGKLAQSLLRKHLPADATYTGIDISSTMIGIAERRLLPWKARSAVWEADGSTRLHFEDAVFDRFVITYVLDLLPMTAIATALAEAHRVLGARGRLCAVVSTEGLSLASRIVASLWKRAYALSPRLVGGCRPLRLAPLLAPNHWRIEHQETLSSWGICSEVVVATPI